jgi:hypothetical protein
MLSKGTEENYAAINFEFYRRKLVKKIDDQKAKQVSIS